ncbi:hypothetical protein SB49_00220 [Sediminicola sp. YIK13]|uniref:hypothetical protein n=1 Tax=Sediminicola sp. YIK13 TaxID=1453352 RepID=UPI0007217FED|nr:hypothetical protein [Sediminicola sp. YIK13]ALM06412.1 hypothetical protein SB49_00220 [Sediminicola sp. YIK13]
MIEFFRRIRQQLLSENKFSKYLMYAVGEIVLVVIGILIALWLNNLNQEKVNTQERKNLKTELIAELSENKEFFKNYKAYAEECGKKVIEILNVSASENTQLPIDTIRKYGIDMMPFRSISIDESRRNSAKSAGLLNLLNSEESTAIAKYETVLENYKEARRINTVWKQENRTLFLYMNSFNILVKENALLKHPDYDLSDDEFISYLKKKETYVKLNDIFVSTEVDVRWLDGII